MTLALVPRCSHGLRAVLLGLSTLPGCIVPLTVGDGEQQDGDGSGDEDPASTESDSETDASLGLPTSGGTDDTGASTGGDPSDDSGSTGDCMGVCFADFGCIGQEPGCVDAVTIETWVSETVVDCAQVETCGDACFCDGSICVEAAPEPCPADTFCVEGSALAPHRAQCLPDAEVCGGPEGLTCGADEFCEYAEMLCPDCVDDPGGCGVGSPLGRCVAVPPPEDDCGPPIPDSEQCGCDGLTYPNECERIKAGVPLAEDGVCPE